MRTTLDIEDDLLAAAKDLARRENVSAGQVISRLARLALTARVDNHAVPFAVSDFRPFAARGVMVSNDQVNALREAEGI